MPAINNRKATLESEIYKKTGVSIRGIPPDGRSRKFSAGGREWLALSVGDCGLFGCLSSGELYSVSGGAASSHKICRASNVRLTKADADIIAIGNAMQDSGQKMSEADLDRYIEALARSIAAATKIAG